MTIITTKNYKYYNGNTPTTPTTFIHTIISYTTDAATIAATVAATIFATYCCFY